MRASWIALVLAACSHAGTRSSTTPAEHAAMEEPAQTKPARTVVTNTDIELLDPIAFFPASDAIEPRSIPTLDAIAKTFVANTSIELVEVQAFAPDALPGVRARLAVDRARVIVEQLVTRGVARNRLTPEGYDTLPPGNPKGAPLFVVVRWAK
jgi:outer membrane protein OmpA-like peptidoglycan-associated protein